MTQSRRILLGVNIDHVATVRQARRSSYPDPVKAALDAEEAGADGITLHLREDRRHIQDQDVYLLRKLLQTRMNLEIAVTEEMLSIAEKVKPQHICLVPEKRQEITTEGGLNVVIQEQEIKNSCVKLTEAGAEVSLFIDPEFEQIDAAVRCGVAAIELHTGAYAEATNQKQRAEELARLEKAANHGLFNGLIVNAGHGLHYHNVEPVARIAGINELNIGHAIIAHALFVGMKTAVKEMLQLLDRHSKRQNK